MCAGACSGRKRRLEPILAFGVLVEMDTMLGWDRHVRIGCGGQVGPGACVQGIPAGG